MFLGQPENRQKQMPVHLVDMSHRFAEFIEWEKVLDQINYIVMRNITKDASEGLVSEFVQSARSAEDQLLEAQKICEFDGQRMKHIVNEIGTLVLGIEKEIECFMVQFTHKGKGLLHTYCLDLLYSIYGFVREQ